MAIDPSAVDRNDPKAPEGASAFHAADKLVQKVKADRDAKKVAEEKKAEQEKSN